MRTSSIVQRACWVITLTGVVVSFRGVCADVSGQPDDWKFDVIRLHTGRVFQGLVLKETPALVRLQCIRRRPGEGVRFGPIALFAKQEIARIDRLDVRERDKLEARLEKLKPASEKERMGSIELASVAWRGVANAGRSYIADHFVLTSDARADIVRRVAVRLEQLYEAYTRYLPPHCRKIARTQILLVRSNAEYREMLGKKLGDILNPAFFDPVANQIICATDLEKLEDELDRLHRKYQQFRAHIREQQAAILRMRNPPPEIVQELVQRQTAIRKAEKENAEAFEKATACLFQTLYHEAFHAYLAGFVYPAAENQVPRWLDEGLAQIFETAILEAGELRVGHADPERLKHVKDALRKNRLVAVADLLKAGPDKYLVAHANDQQLSDAYYQASWALAFYLTFGQRKLGTPELNAYVRSLKNGARAEDAFCLLVGEPLPAFEESFQRYLRALQADGSTVK
jgi:hypothetical protein